MHPLKLIAVTTAFGLVVLAPAFAGPEMPMYQFPQANQMSTLRQPTPIPHDVACTPVTSPPPQGGTQIVAASTPSSQVRYHVVDGKCVPVGGK